MRFFVFFMLRSIIEGLVAELGSFVEELVGVEEEDILGGMCVVSEGCVNNWMGVK